MKMSLSEVAGACGISPSHLSRIERGDTSRVPSEALARRIAKRLGLDADAVLVASGRIPGDVEKYLVRTPGAIERVREMMRAA